MGTRVEKTAAFIKVLLEGRPTPQLLIICGSGLSELSASVEEKGKMTISYSSIPDFPKVSVQGHAGEMVFGTLSGVECMILRGRFHSYEGHSMEDCVLPVRVAHAIGCKLMLVTNAAGGINRDFNVGDVALISDHIGIPLLAGKGPLVGPNDSSLGPRFPAMSNAYDQNLRNLAFAAAQELGLADIVRFKATYAFVSGPAYETAAESAMLRMFGADLVGMSTVPEVVAARHCGMRVLGISLVTNKVVLPGDVNPVHASHEEVLDTTRMRTADIQRLVERIVFTLKSHEAEVEFSKTLPSVVNTVPKSTSLGGGNPKQSSLNGGNQSQLLESKLREIDVSKLTPLEAIKVLADLKAMLN